MSQTGGGVSGLSLSPGLQAHQNIGFGVQEDQILGPDTKGVDVEDLDDKDEEDKRIVVPLFISYLLYTEKKFSNSKVPPKIVKIFPLATLKPWNVHMTGYTWETFKREVFCVLNYRPKLMDFMIDANKKKLLKWTGSILNDSRFPKIRPAVLEDYDSFSEFAARAEAFVKNPCTILVTMDNPANHHKSRASENEADEALLMEYGSPKEREGIERNFLRKEINPKAAMATEIQKIVADL